MNVIGKKVKHKKFGIGVVKNVQSGLAHVEFSFGVGEKIFSYPEMFNKFLEIVKDEHKKEPGDIRKNTSKEININTVNKIETKENDIVTDSENYDYKKALNRFNIPLELKSQFELLLCHKQVLNESDNLWFVDNQGYYQLIGKYIFEYDIRLYILSNITQDMNVVTTLVNCSKEVIANQYYFYFELDKLARFVTVTEVSPKLRAEACYKFLGFLLCVTGYKNTHNSLMKVLRPDLLQLSDYKTIINTRKDAYKFNYKYLGEQGPAHDITFAYELNVDKEQYRCYGKSKKSAEQECARQYCLKHYTMAEMIDILKSTSKKKRSVAKKYVISSADKNNIQRAANKIGISEDELMICLTHQGFLNQYQVKGDCSNVSSIGSFIKRIFLCMSTYDYSDDIKLYIQTMLIGYLHKHVEIDERLIKKYNLDTLIRVLDNLQDEGLKNFYADINNGIMHYLFLKNNNFESEWFKSYWKLCKKVIDNLDFRYIDPKTQLQELLTPSGMAKFKYEYGIEEKYIKCSLSSSDNKMIFTETASSKVEASQKAACSLLKFLHEKFIAFYQGYFQPGKFTDDILHFLDLFSDVPDVLRKINREYKLKPINKLDKQGEYTDEELISACREYLTNYRQNVFKSKENTHVIKENNSLLSAIKSRTIQPQNVGLFIPEKEPTQIIQPIQRKNVEEIIRKDDIKELKSQYEKLKDELMQTKTIIKSINKLMRGQDKQLQEALEIKEHNDSRIIVNYEIRQQLEKALTNAKQEIDIISPWISYELIRPLYSLMDELVSHGVKIKIRYGIGDDNRRSATDEAAADIKRRYKNSNLVTLKSDNTHSKLLICDDEYFIITSFNFLSFFGDYTNGHTRGELGQISYDKENLLKLREKFFSF